MTLITALLKQEFAVTILMFSCLFQMLFLRFPFSEVLEHTFNWGAPNQTCTYMHSSIRN